MNRLDQCKRRTKTPITNKKNANWCLAIGNIFAEPAPTKLKAIERFVENVVHDKLRVFLNLGNL